VNNGLLNEIARTVTFFITFRVTRKSVRNVLKGLRRLNSSVYTANKQNCVNSFYGINILFSFCVNLTSAYDTSSSSPYSVSIRAGLSGDRIVLGARFFEHVQSRPGTHAASYKMGTGSVFPGLKRPGCGVKHQLPSSAEVKERVELCLYALFGTLWTVLGRILSLLLDKL
jgi:hypothetical protein